MIPMLLWGLISGSAAASTIIPPSNYGEMVNLSDLVVKAEVISGEQAIYGGIVYTKTSVRVLDVFKGKSKVGDIEFVYHLGGKFGDQMAVVSGGPQLEQGDVLILSLRESGPGWTMWLLSYGQLRLSELVDGTQVFGVLEESASIEYEHIDGDLELPGIYRAGYLESHIRDIVSMSTDWDARIAGSLQLVGDGSISLKTTSNGIVLPAGCSMLEANGGYGRWQGLGGSTVLRIFTQNEATLADRDAIVQSVNNWGAVQGTSLSALSFSGNKTLPSCGADGLTTPLRTQLLEDYELYVAYNDPCNNLEPTVNCVGILATAQHFVTSATHMHRGQSWSNMSKGIVIVNKGIQSCLSSVRFQQTIQHEIGHLLGFGHHTIEPANMNAACCNPLTAKDVACAQYVYGTMALNPTPVIARLNPDVVPQGTTLTVTVEGMGFMPESAVAIGGSDIQIQSVNYRHENRIDVTVMVLRSAIPSSRAFRVTNPTPGGGRSQDMAFTVTASTAIPERDDDGVPYAFRLGQNFPNPFNPSTVIPFEIPWQTWVTMDLLDNSGKLVKRLVDSEVQAGRHKIRLNGEGLPSGVYMVRLRSDAGVEISKITLSK